MAKKFVRGITNIKDINKQDFDTNNVNDLLSDGEHNYIHRKKKDKSEEYHNLTDNLKTLSSDNTDLLSVTNYNKSTNTATLSPKHDAQKEQVLTSPNNTLTFKRGANGTSETTKIDTNPQKVLEHDNLLAGGGLIKKHDSDTETSTLSADFNLVQEKLEAGEGIEIEGNTIHCVNESNNINVIASIMDLDKPDGGTQKVRVYACVIDYRAINLSLSAPSENEYIDLSNLSVNKLGAMAYKNWFGFGYSVNPTCSIIYENESGAILESKALYTVDGSYRNKLTIMEDYGITPASLLSNLTKVKSISLT